VGLEERAAALADRGRERVAVVVGVGDEFLAEAEEPLLGLARRGARPELELLERGASIATLPSSRSSLLLRGSRDVERLTSARSMMSCTVSGLRRPAGTGTPASGSRTSE